MVCLLLGLMSLGFAPGPAVEPEPPVADAPVEPPMPVDERPEYSPPQPPEEIWSDASSSDTVPVAVPQVLTDEAAPIPPHSAKERRELARARRIEKGLMAFMYTGVGLMGGGATLVWTPWIATNDFLLAGIIAFSGAGIVTIGAIVTGFGGGLLKSHRYHHRLGKFARRLSLTGPGLSLRF